MPSNHAPACRAGTASKRTGVPARQAGKYVVTVVPGLALRASPWAITLRAFSPPKKDAVKTTHSKVSSQQPRRTVPAGCLEKIAWLTFTLIL